MTAPASTPHLSAAEHVEAAEKLIAKAHAVDIVSAESSQLARTYALMARVHIAIALELRLDFFDSLAIPSVSTESDTTRVFERAYPDNVVWATTAVHGFAGDLSRADGDYAVVTSESKDAYIGAWLEGFGFVEVNFPKETTRPLTTEERERLATSEVVIL